MGGLAVGVLLGIFVAIVGVAAVSLSSPLPPRDGEQVATAAAPEAAEPPQDDAVEAVGTAEQAADPAPEAAADPDADPAPDAEQDAAPAPDAAPEPDAAQEADPASEPAGAPSAEGPTPTPAPQTDEAAPVTDIPLPAGSEFNRPPPEPEAALPSAETAPSAAAPQAPALAGETSGPSFDTAPAAQPEVGVDTPVAPTAGVASAPATSPGAEAAPAATQGPAVLSQPEELPSPEVETAALAPAQTDGSALGAVTPEATDAAPVDAPVAPEDQPLTEAASEEAAPAEGDAGEIAAVSPPAAPRALALPQAGVAPEGAPNNSPEGAPDVAPEGAPDNAPEGAPENAPEGAPDVTPEVAPDNAPDNAPAGLPQAEPQDEAAPEESGADEAPATAQPQDLPALRAFAADFDATQSGPLMSVVLIDDPDSRIEVATLTRFSFPVAFAVDPLHPEAAARAQAYRDAGFEVMILGTMIGDGAGAADVEVALAAAQQVLPQAIAVLDTPESRIQGDRPVLDAVVGVLAETGHGLVAFPRGLNAAEQSANRLGVPGATVFRLLDDEDQRATVITRFLSRAAFTAGQEGSVIVVGHTRPDTVTALFSWALGGRSEGVVLAPLSATLERGSGG